MLSERASSFRLLVEMPPLGILNQRATEGIRTHDLAFTKRLLYRLSYGGVGQIIQYRPRFDKRN